MRVGGPGGGLDRRPRDTGRPVGDVVGDRVIEQHGVLRDDANPRPQRTKGHIAEVDPIDEDATAGDVVEPRDQVDQGRLARTAQPHDGHHLTSSHDERYAAQDLAPVVALVRKAHVAELDGVPNRLERPRAGPVLRLGMCIEDLEDPFRRRDRLLDIGIDAAELPASDHS